LVIVLIGEVYRVVSRELGDRTIETNLLFIDSRINEFLCVGGLVS